MRLTGEMAMGMKQAAASETTMTDAFAAAGYCDPHKRMMRQAVLDGGGIEARVLAAFSRMLPKSADAQLIRNIVGDELFRSAVYTLFRDTYNEIRREQSAGTKAASDANSALPQGRISRAEEAAPNVVSAKVSPSMPKGQVAVAKTETAPNAAARVENITPIGPSIVSPAAAPTRVNYTGRIEIARESLLRKVMINGQPLADVTAGEARSWLRSHDRDGHFVRLLAQPMQEEMRFGAWYQDEGEVEKIWRRSQEMADAVG